VSILRASERICSEKHIERAAAGMRLLPPGFALGAKSCGQGAGHLFSIPVLADRLRLSRPDDRIRTTAPVPHGEEVWANKESLYVFHCIQQLHPVQRGADDCDRQDWPCARRTCPRLRRGYGHAFRLSPGRGPAPERRERFVNRRFSRDQRADRGLLPQHLPCGVRSRCCCACRTCGACGPHWTSHTGDC